MATLRERLAAAVAGWRGQIALLDKEPAEKKDDDGPAGWLAGQMEYRIDDGTDMFINNKGKAVWLRESYPWRLEFDKPYTDTEPMGMTAYSSYELSEWDYGTRYDVLTRCHQVWERNPLVNTGVAYARMFAVGTGMVVATYSAEVKDLLSAFIEENDIMSLEKSICDALQVDGEVFFRFFKKAGKTTMRVIPPWQVKDIQTDENDLRRILGYTLIKGVVKPEDMIHLAINRLPYEVRGRPEIFSVLPWAKAYKDWLEERVRVNRRKSILWDVKLTGATPAQVSAKRSQYKEPPPPGSIVVHNDKEEWNSIVANIDAGRAEPDGRRILLMVACGLRLAEYFFSDGSNANLASARAQALPALKKFADLQAILSSAWEEVFKLVIRNAVEKGLVPAQVQQTTKDGQPVLDEDEKPMMILAEDAFSVTYPDLEEEEIKALVEALTIAVNNKWVSNETAAAMAGFDPEVEARKIAQEKQAMQQSPQSPVAAEEENPGIKMEDENATTEE